jgi:ABC-type Na+ efflux pump permease subunit
MTLNDNLGMLPPPTPQPQPAPARRSRATWDFVVIGVLVAVIVVMLGFIVVEMGKKNEAEKQVAEITSRLDAASAKLSATETELSGARAAADSKSAEVSRLESEAVELRQCAQGLVRSMSAALDEDWITANSILESVKPECQMAMQGSTTL